MINRSPRKIKASEGRRSPRLLATFLIRYFLFDGTPGENIARTANTKDVSESGVRFVTSEKLEAGDLLRLQILIPALGDSPLGAFARVLHCESETPGVYRVSADFLEIRDEDHARLKAFIDSRLQTKEAGHLFSTGRIFKRAAGSAKNK
ncbi:MAG: PilZ domain-containing protein [Candidatus Omnitrophica bacterium]|nr:PilZ domain-containing protein [Candidatus Omnitrophota bacterium]